MKILLATLVGVIAIGATFPAFAGPDWQRIEQGRKVNLTHMQQNADATTPAKAAAPAGNPRELAQVPGNGERNAQMMKECAAMMKGATHDMNVK